MRNQCMLTRVACTFVFALFSFYYLYDYQADVLTVMQHELSKGQTHYNHFVGAVLITLVGLLLQFGVANLFRSKRLAWALTFVPTALCLAMLTNIGVSAVDGTLYFGAWSWLSPLLIALFFAAVWAVDKSGLLASLPDISIQPIRELWVNLLIVAMLLLTVCLAGNGDKLYHSRIHAEQCLVDGDYDGALETIGKCRLSDKNLSMLSIYALSRKGELAERLFDYPMTGVDAMLPNGKDVRFELYPEYRLYKYLGGRYKQKMAARRFINFQRRTGHVNRAMADYVLCAHLLDRDLNAFAHDLPKYYTVSDSVALPRHYCEALTLYMHTHSTPVVVYKDNVQATDYEDYQNMKRKYAGMHGRSEDLRLTYGNTYWYYYDFGAKP